MKNFTIEFNTTDRHFALELTGTMRNFEIRPGVGPAGPAGPQGDEGPQGPQGDPGPNSVTSSTTSDGTADLSLNSLEVTNTTSANGIDINVTDSAYGIYVLAENGIGVSGYSYDGSGIGGTSDNGSGGAFSSNNSYGAIITSLSSTALQLNTVSGNYYVECQNNYTTIDAAIERVRGWFVWFYNTFTGRLKTADITADRDWTLPDQSGIIAVSSIESANFTAANGGSYVIVNNVTVTDPTPSEGAGYTVFIRNGTATVGGTAYSVAGTVIKRVFHSGSWVNYPYSSALFGTGVRTALGNTANATGGFVTADGTATVSNKDFSNCTGYAYQNLTGIQRAIRTSNFSRPVGTYSTAQQADQVLTLNLLANVTYRVRILAQFIGTGGSQVAGGISAPNSQYAVMVAKRTGNAVFNAINTLNPWGTTGILATVVNANQTVEIEYTIRPLVDGATTILWNPYAGTGGVSIIAGSYIQSEIIG